MARGGALNQLHMRENSQHRVCVCSTSVNHLHMIHASLRVFCHMDRLGICLNLSAGSFKVGLESCNNRFLEVESITVLCILVDYCRNGSIFSLYKLEPSRHHIIKCLDSSFFTIIYSIFSFLNCGMYYLLHIHYHHQRLYLCLPCQRHYQKL